MVQLLLLCCVLVGDNGESRSASATDRATYESAARQAGKEPKAQIRLALWCEAHGLTAERARHLALAIATDPANVLARGLAGLVAQKGNWKPAEEIERESRNDPAWQALIREYLERRARTPHTADAQLKLAAWCGEKGLKEQALAHYTEVTRIDPARELASKKLGYVKKGNRWVKPEDAAAQRVELERQKKADQHWKPQLEKMREGLESSSSARRDKARVGLAQVTDPRAVPMVMKVFASSGEEMQLVAVGVLSHIDGPAASFCLAALAVDGPSAEVRRRAADTLKRRDPRDVIGWLTMRVHRRYKYEVKPADRPGATAVLLVDGERFDIRQFYRLPEFLIDPRLVPRLQLATLPITNGVTLPFGDTPYGRLSGGLALAQNSARASEVQRARVFEGIEEARNRVLAVVQSLDDDVRMLDALNAQIEQTNEHVLPLLEGFAGQSFGTDSKAWQAWWTNQLGVEADPGSSSAPDSKPTFFDMVTAPDVVETMPVVVQSCFAAGTLVHTDSGPQAIESIRVGDLLLSQNTATGELAFCPVLRVFRNKPRPTLKLRLGDDSVVATAIHPFWKVATGWTLARDLRAGDQVRAIGGALSIRSIEANPVQPVYNFDVAKNRDFFVGRMGILVHDLSFVEPVLEPFDRLVEPAPRETRAAVTARP
jgi:Pretoxin HINT domain